MKKFNFSSKKGFTLIELLVVIGILAVLVAIAIPTVAGLIDRANVSADETNANEMTNAVERFASEYELFRQDVASGRIDLNDLDSAQARVYNVVKTIDRADITAIESKTGLNGIRLDKENKYPQNQATAKAIMENYMKTSTSTFEPKQSDKSYWYNTLTGYTIVADTDIDTSTLYEHLPVKVRYSNSQPAALNEWVDLSVDFEIPDVEIIYHAKGTPAGENIKTPYAIDFIFDFKKPIKEVSYASDIYMMHCTSLNENEDVLLNVSNNKNMYKLFKTQNSQTVDSTLKAFQIKNIPQNALDGCLYIRLCYSYTIDGKTHYAYSPIFKAVYNQAPETLPQTIKDRL